MTLIVADAVELLGAVGGAAMVFADPPDNIGLQYDNGRSDAMDRGEYVRNLATWLDLSAVTAPVVWFSVNAIWQSAVWAWASHTSADRDVRMIPWYFTFGQHRHSDLGNNYRPIFRISVPGFVWNTDAIRIPSKRQQMGDKRADPRGRVPGDVWGGPADTPGLCRVQGNNRERRSWHPTQHPEGIVERAILMSTHPGDLVVDPFMGTGTTLRACLKTGRRCITGDISETYVRKVSEETGEPVADVHAAAPLMENET